MEGGYFRLEELDRVIKHHQFSLKIAYEGIAKAIDERVALSEYLRAADPHYEENMREYWDRQERI